MPEQTLSIRGIDPLLFGDGRPFGDEDGALTARTLPIPYPSTVAGFLRTKLGAASGWKWPGDSAKALGVAVAGPVLLMNDKPVFPTPADALILKAPDAGLNALPLLLPLRPVSERTSGAGCDMPDGIAPPEAPLDDHCEGKPASGYHFWPEAALANWLASPSGGGRTSPAAIAGPPHELRAHVAIGQDGHAEEGKLYTTDLLAFHERERKWAFLAQLDAGERVLGVGTLGGERRLAAIEAAPVPWPTCPDPIRNVLAEATLVRMYLATPAIFEGGWKPGWLKEHSEGLPSAPGLKLKLISAAIPRRQAVSGWDLKARGPKALRWLAPAGSIYFFEVIEGDAAALLGDAWLKSVSDGKQDRLDGWGLAMWGVWDYQGAQK